MRDSTGGAVFTTLIRRRIAMLALDAAARAIGVSVAELNAKSRRRTQAAAARQIAMYLCHVVGKLRISDIAAEFERDRTTAMHACHSIEDRREDPVFDGLMAALEAELRDGIADMIADLQRRNFRTVRRRRFERKADCAYP